jgi:3-dehydroquinate synthetase
VLRREPARMTAIVADCVRTKAAIVARDPFEAGERKQLNLGHTFAHAIEHAAGFGAVPHGVAVAVGLVLALRASHALGLLADTALPERIERLLTAFGLPASLDALRTRTGSALEPARIASAMRMDKKGEAGAVRLVLPERAGRLRCDVAADERVLAQILAG